MPLLTDAFSDDIRKCFYDAIEFMDAEQQYVIADTAGDTLSYSAGIVCREAISGRPTDEELTRALILLHLIKRYGYASDRIVLEERMTVPGHACRSVPVFENDIMIYSEDRITVESLIEVKRITDYKGASDRQIDLQLFKALNHRPFSDAQRLYFVSCDIPMDRASFPLVCIGIDTGVCGSYAEWCAQGRPPHFIDFCMGSGAISEIKSYVKLSGNENGLSASFRDLNDNFSIDTIRRAWRTIWDGIWGGTLESNKKFENFNKVLLAKIFDERKTNIGVAYGFQKKFVAGRYQTNAELAWDVDLLYRKAYVEYFCRDKSTELKTVKGIDFDEFSYDLIALCVEQLSPYSFDRNKYKNVDVLGEFYEMVVRESFKQTEGLFLTHPNIVLFILAALDVDELVTQRLRQPDDARFRLPFVIDPSCGTGTFLVYYMTSVQKLIEEHHEDIAAGDYDVQSFIAREMRNENVYKWVKDYVFGIDNDSVLATACQLNQILHGDGSTNVYFADGLDSFANYEVLNVVGATNMLSSSRRQSTSYYGKETLEKFDLIITNPPFNVNLSRGNLAADFTITGKSEAYFLERWYQLLKPRGRIGAVLPESFFAVEDDVRGRVFLYKHFNMKCLVSLPNFTFSPYTTTSTSLLFAEKKTREEEELFMAQYAQSERIFLGKRDSIRNCLPRRKQDVSFCEDTSRSDSIVCILERVQKRIIAELGEQFVVLPYYDAAYICDERNYTAIKSKINNLLTDAKERWILHQLFCVSDCIYTNYAVDNIGYKAGKKGSKDKPNELMTILDAENQQIYNLKFAHSWAGYDAKDLNTVLGLIKEQNIWQSLRRRIACHI